MPTDYPAIAEQPLAPQVAQGGNSDVIINKVSNGFVVRIGCKVLVAKTWQEVSEGLALYWKDSNAARQKYCLDEAYLKPKGVKRDLSRNRPRKIGGNRKAKR